MAEMTKNQLIDAIAEGTQISKEDVRAVIEHMATVGYKELNQSGEFVIPGFVKMSVVNKPATEARSGVNPFTKEPMEFAAKPASKSVKASPLLPHSRFSMPHLDGSDRELPTGTRNLVLAAEFIPQGRVPPKRGG